MEKYEPREFQGRTKKQYESTGKIMSLIFILASSFVLLGIIYISIR
jgi:hypothetical protein